MIYHTPADAVFFCKTREEWGCFSNMHSQFPIKLPTGLVAASSEALYQALRFPSDPQLQHHILTTYNPFQAKLLAKSAVRKTMEGWSEPGGDTPTSLEDAMLQPRVRAMVYALQAKARWGSIVNNRIFAAELQRSRPRTIYERSHRDTFWGVRLAGGVWCGYNVLGVLLMKLRDEGLHAPPPRAPFLLREMDLPDLA